MRQPLLASQTHPLNRLLATYALISNGIGYLCSWQAYALVNSSSWIKNTAKSQQSSMSEVSMSLQLATTSFLLEQR